MVSEHTTVDGADQREGARTRVIPERDGDDDIQTHEDHPF